MSNPQQNTPNSVQMLSDYLEDLERSGVKEIRKVPRQNKNASGPSSTKGTKSTVSGSPAPTRATASTVPSSPGPSSQSNVMDTTPIVLPVKNEPVVFSQSLQSILTTTKSREEKLAALAQQVSQCTLCPNLAPTRTQTVFGSGNPNAELVFIGEGPGADEDKQGLPFVGRSGQLLTDIITKGMQIRREDVYICNIVRCRPPGNRAPVPAEAKACRPFLEATLKVIAPKYICCLGASAATYLLQTDQAIGKLRGKVMKWHEFQVVCTYHPAYLLRNPPAKVQTWEDIKLLMTIMGLAR